MSANLGQLLLDGLDGHWQKYSKRLSDCRQEINDENIHDFRVSTRKLLSLIELCRAINHKNRLTKLLQIFKNQLKGLNELRDTQVMLLEVDKTLVNFPELQPFYQFLADCEQQLLIQTRLLIKSIKLSKLNRKLKRSKRNFKKCFISKSDTNLAVLAVIDSMQAVVLSRLKAVDPEQLSSIHHLRIAVKKFRNVVEDTHTGLPDYPEPQLQAMKDFLILMGDIQNSAVLSRALNNFFVAGVPVGIQEYFQNRQQELLNSFMFRKSEIFGFWRGNQLDGISEPIAK